MNISGGSSPSSGDALKRIKIAGRKSMSTGTKQSPRVENGVLKWYVGNAFYINFTITNDSDGKLLGFNENDYVKVIFRDKRRIIKTFDVREVEEGRIQIHMDSRSTCLFGVGKYHYDIELYRNGGETIQTLYKCGEAEVEGCDEWA